jgi:hypothetical protein
MPVDAMFWLATAAFAWGLSLATYRWFAVYNNWPMGAWHSDRPGLPIAIGVFVMLVSLLYAGARGGPSLVMLPLFGFFFSLAWTALTRVGSQVSLLLAPGAMVALLVFWTVAASHVAAVHGVATVPGDLRVVPSPAATDRDSDIRERERAMSGTAPRPLAPLPR